MARVTVEDCVLQVPNRFDLVMKAAQRAREISSGGELTIERDNDKNPVVALREIADETVSLDELDEALIKNLQKFVEADEPEPDEGEFEIPLNDALAQAAFDNAPAPAAPRNEAEEPAEMAPRISFEDVDRND